MCLKTLRFEKKVLNSLRFEIQHPPVPTQIYAAKISDQFAVINFLIGIKVRFTEESDATVFGHVNQSSHVCLSPSNENVVT